ncbi:MAG: aldehyde dehydrogenase family protein, partial [Actinobacteria bacterium]|nr:aldehyde dehydrogenase family protein [Actinomycetota bacterium]
MTDYAVVNPATGETLATYDTFTDAQTDEAVAAAHDAYLIWGKTPVSERAALVRRAAELHRERRDHLAELIVREMGKPLEAALGEVDFAADITEFYADNAERITADQPLDILGEGTAVIRRSPL